MKKQQYIGVCVVHPCVTEQYSISVFKSKFEKEGGKKFELVFLQVFVSFLRVRNKPLETSYTGIKSLHVSSMNSTVCNTEPSCLLENSSFYLPNF